MIELWTCGHLANSVCAECYRELAEKANMLAEECERLLEENHQLKNRRLWPVGVPDNGGD
jgi:hypothetical protein